ncbi:MAG: hypothetical protein FWD17_10245 [Polyangiaceae bacterium]|nr:hypothetical protein [Polyangiaceae bacterium]
MSLEEHNLDEIVRSATSLDEARGRFRFDDEELHSLETEMDLISFARHSGYEAIAGVSPLPGSGLAHALLEHPNGDRIAVGEVPVALSRASLQAQGRTSAHDALWGGVGEHRSEYTSMRDVDRESARRLFYDAVAANEPQWLRVRELRDGPGCVCPYHPRERRKDYGTVIDFVRTRDPAAQHGAVSISAVRERLRAWDAKWGQALEPAGLTPPRTPAIVHDWRVERDGSGGGGHTSAGRDAGGARVLTLHLAMLTRFVNLSTYARSFGYELQPHDAMFGVQVLKHPGTHDRIAVAHVAAGDIYAALPADRLPEGVKGLRFPKVAVAHYRLPPADDDPSRLSCVRQLERRRHLYLYHCITRSPDKGTIVDFERRRHRLIGHPEPDLETVRKHLSVWFAQQQRLARENAKPPLVPSHDHDRGR